MKRFQSLSDAVEGLVRISTVVAVLGLLFVASLVPKTIEFLDECYKKWESSRQ